MKYCLAIFLFATTVTFSHAQDSVVHLSPGMFDKNQVITLFSLNGWRFRQGNDSAWANPTANTNGWEKRKPRQVTKQLADRNGRIEGWFRLKILLDTSFGNLPLYFTTSYWAATDAYIDGKLFESYGNTGKDGSAFHVPDRTDKLQMKRVQLMPGKQHVLAIHIVNYSPAFPLSIITRNADLGPSPLLSGPALIRNMNAYYNVSRIYQIVSITVCVILSLLFWLLAFQNPHDGTLRLIALCPTCFAFAVWMAFIQLNSSLSLAGYLIIRAIGLLFDDSIVLLTPIILAKIFTNKVPRKLLAALSIMFIIMYYSRSNDYKIPVLLVVVTVVIIALYYVISSWRILKGAQWAIVWGVLATLFWVMLWGFI
ncbi:MAG TPA: hypothetical protein VEY06_04210, partial [Flavisolibacter sp.]|nr:hypothetical protein [Flavisolibacter sp.]